MRARCCLAGIALTASWAAARADVSLTPAIASDYDFRGYTQTAREPALQASLDYAHGPIHLDAWASNLDFGPHDARAELDLVADYSFGSVATLKLETGIVYYVYPGHDKWAFPEAWLAASRGWFSLAYHHALSWDASGHPASYLEADATVPIGATGVSVGGHIGYSFGAFWSRLGLAAGGTGEYIDYAVSVSRSFGHFNATLRWVDSNGIDVSAAYGPRRDVFSNDGRIVALLSTTLPWGK